MTKLFCDICGKEMETYPWCSYVLTFANQSKFHNNQEYLRDYNAVCKDCAEKIANIIDTLKEDKND